MDWAKSKIILIIALIITNIILFTYILNDYNARQDKTLSKEFIGKTVQLLEDEGIKLDTHIPTSKSKLPSLLVEFESYDKKDLNEKFFARNGKIEDPNSEFTQITFNTETLSIINTRRIIYENSMKITQKKEVDFAQAQELAKIFLMDRGFNVQNMQCNYFEEEDNVFRLSFSKLYEGVVIERSYTNFVIDNGVVTSMDRLWIDVKNKSQNEIYLSSAPKSLLRLLEDSSDYYNSTITSIKECYYFDPEEQGYVDDITRVMQGRAIPAWRIQFDDGTNTVVNSF
ncbi:MAG: two-component system regulatory protein YycI [Peptoniphilus sp.]|nr:two-component system regulatory protein YycI [Peptoniphilus sp.]